MISDSVVAEFLGGPRDGATIAIPSNMKEFVAYLPPPIMYDATQDDDTYLVPRKRICPVVKGIRNGHVVYGIDWTNGVTR